MPYKFLINDPLQPNWAIETERKKITPGKLGWGKTSDAALAKEIKQRRPWTIVREYEDNNGMKATRPTFIMPRMPWKVDPDEVRAFAQWYNETYQKLQELKNGTQSKDETPGG